MKSNTKAKLILRAAKAVIFALSFTVFISSLAFETAGRFSGGELSATLFTAFYGTSLNTALFSDTSASDTGSSVKIAYGSSEPEENTSSDASPSVNADIDETIADDSSVNSSAERYSIIKSDLSTSAEYGLEASNQTSYDIDLSEYLSAEIAAPTLDEIKAEYMLDDYVPIVLIVHTHGTEAYSPEDTDTYSTDNDFRSSDISENVVAVGAEMADYLNACGITTIHCTEMFDLESYVDAYSRSAAAISEYCAIYPSISYVFDVHRDCIITDELECVSSSADVNGVAAAQFMCVVGTDEYAGTHTGWRDNLTLACHLQYELWSVSPTITRRLSIRTASYNQKYTQGSLLFEIGTCGSTLNEAKSCALIVAKALAKIIKGEGDA